MEGNSVCIYPKEPTKIGAQRKGMRDFPGKQYTNLDATQVIRTGEHADGCRVDAHAFPSFSPVCQYISICTPCFNTQGTYYHDN
ncbi:hypothetical protein T09_991 [Trichinella sp. T9]|nr:hypothetical protein T09_991 [Trichinella sp. T9]